MTSQHPGGPGGEDPRYTTGPFFLNRLNNASFHAILQSIQLLGGSLNKVLALCVPLVTSIGFLSQQQEEGHAEVRANANLWVLFLGFRGENWWAYKDTCW